jgi:hypothetical protein
MTHTMQDSCGKRAYHASCVGQRRTPDDSARGGYGGKVASRDSSIDPLTTRQNFSRGMQMDSEGYKVLVCGGRDYNNTGYVWDTLREIHMQRPIAQIIHGGATGADTAAKRWAELNSVGQYIFPVTQEDWRELGRKAGPLRNQRMLDLGKPDVVVAFPGGTGTADMVRRAEKAGVTVVRVE